MYLIYLFDFDYTLGDATEAIVDSVNHALSHMGFPAHTRDEIRRTVGMSLPETFTHLTQSIDPSLRTAFHRLFMQKADEVMTAKTELYPDTVGVLTQLKNSGVKIGIVTTKYHYRIDAILDKFGIAHLIDVIVGADDVQNPKPHPEAVLTALGRLNAEPGDAVLVGDSVIDAKTAQSAGVDFIAVTTGTTKPEEFLPFPHLRILKDLSELLRR